MALLIAILTLVNVVPVNFNDEKYYGIQGVVIVILYIPFIGGTMAVVNWIFLSFGNFMLKLFLSMFASQERATTDESH
jgi:hypothetical protein